MHGGVFECGWLPAGEHFREAPYGLRLNLGRHAFAELDQQVLDATVRVSYLPSGDLLSDMLFDQEPRSRLLVKVNRRFSVSRRRKSRPGHPMT